MQSGNVIINTIDGFPPEMWFAIRSMEKEDKEIIDEIKSLRPLMDWINDYNNPPIQTYTSTKLEGVI